MVRDGYIYGLSLLAVAGVLAWATGTWVLEHCARFAGRISFSGFSAIHSGLFPTAQGWWFLRPTGL